MDYAGLHESRLHHKLIEISKEVSKIHRQNVTQSLMLFMRELAKATYLTMNLPSVEDGLQAFDSPRLKKVAEVAVDEPKIPDQETLGHLWHLFQQWQKELHTKNKAEAGA